jgi:20S proteasome subunit alpha 6
MAIGSRSQTSRTYLEREFENFATCSLDDLIKHALRALASTLAGDAVLDTKSASISVVGKDKAFHTIEGAALQTYLDAIEVDGAVAMEEEEVVANPDI